MSDGLPASPTITNSESTAFKPWEVNPDLAAAVMARDLVNKLPSPAILSKKFVIYHGLFKSINHTEENKTGFSCSPLLVAFEKISEGSVNIDGWYAEHIFAYLMKPKFVIQGMPNQANMFDKQEPGFIERIRNRITGKSDQNQQQAGN